ncbi:hypothetical protein VPH35_087188 [Triticum aestivum]
MQRQRLRDGAPGRVSAYEGGRRCGCHDAWRRRRAATSYVRRLRRTPRRCIVAWRRSTACRCGGTAWRHESAVAGNIDNKGHSAVATVRRSGGVADFFACVGWPATTTRQWLMVSYIKIRRGNDSYNLDLAVREWRTSRCADACMVVSCTAGSC